MGLYTAGEFRYMLIVYPLHWALGWTYGADSDVSFQVRAAGARDGGNFTCAPHRWDLCSQKVRRKKTISENHYQHHQTLTHKSLSLMVCCCQRKLLTWFIFSLRPASVLVTIMDGEGKSAAVHEDEVGGARTLRQTILLLLSSMFSLLVLCWINYLASIHFAPSAIKVLRGQDLEQIDRVIGCD